jgi:hypothetical protein
MEPCVENTLPAQKIKSPVFMTKAIQTFNITLPVNDEVLNLTLFLFCGKPIENQKKNFTYSIIGKVSGMRIVLLNAAITANYGHGFILTDCPVVKENEFIFSNECSQPVALRIKAEIKAADKSGAIISPVFIFEVKYTLHDFIISNASLQHFIKKETRLFPADHLYNRHSLATG